jgi:hypothetical protein
MTGRIEDCDARTELRGRSVYRAQGEIKVAMCGIADAIGR